MIAAGSLPMRVPMRSTDTERTCSACAWESRCCYNTNLRSGCPQVVQAGNQGIEYIVEGGSVLDQVAHLIVQFLDKIHEQMGRAQR